MNKGKRKIDDLNERSDQVREILGKAPHWVIRAGITLIFIIITLLLLGAALISYNDVVTAEIVVSSKNPPVYIKSGASGKLINIFAERGQSVVKGEKLAEVESNARIEDVYYLKGSIKDFEPQGISLDSLKSLFPTHLNLGDIQPSYDNFVIQYQNYVLFNTSAINLKESKVIERQLRDQNFFWEKLQKQRLVLKQKMDSSNKVYEQNKKLHKTGAIDKVEYERFSNRYLTEKQSYEDFRTSMSNTQAAMANFNMLLKKYVAREDPFKETLVQAYKDLNRELLLWEKEHVIKSPIDGKVTVFDLWKKSHTITAEENLFTVLPHNLEEIVGRIVLPIQNAKNIEVGQKVIIKLTNYPFKEWGGLEGKITAISEVPKQGDGTFYSIYVKVNGLTTSLGKHIDFNQEMYGNAEIIIEELTVLERIFYQLRETFGNI
ncbi:HlyD family efflux transporter periplasmic adaptor subunit [Spongiimicrobium sp. 3-5]|uniref:HlyD family efflux transporter periplasmic adaptor subunit n=1 Tax=Spongiimicrobium sp. 3-5 TaxID=3332596 RepID=UPI0039808995